MEIMAGKEYDFLTKKLVKITCKYPFPHNPNFIFIIFNLII